ncbi:MAG TPA: redoxin domain-containing protein [Methylomirabilota bacterium]|nr:redoxin domain-containing protein [Methylomirabilota bacterium]
MRSRRRVEAAARATRLPKGASIPPFRLRDLAGRRVAVEDFRGKCVFLVHWSPQCDFCGLIAPEMSRRQAEFREHNVQLVLVSHGDAESNRKLAEAHGLECPILLQKGVGPLGTIEAFRHLGTPMAYVLDERGRVVQPLAVGADEVPILAREVAAGRAFRRRLPGERPLRESRIERAGLRAGTPAPTFRLPDVYGQTVSLEHYRGRRVLLVFTDPHCEPCDRLWPHLVRLHRRHGDSHLALVIVGRGEPEENRRKAEEYGLQCPVVVQRRWELSREYGIFTTPVAFLIGEDGVIERNVAKGSNEILALARELRTVVAGSIRRGKKRRSAESRPRPSLSPE